jgi:hypothetical protein
VKPEKLRAKGERDLAKLLLSDPYLKRLIDRYEQTKQQEARRYLLGTSVRLTPSMTPEVHKVAERCGSVLAIEEPVEIYVSPNPGFNAFSYGGEDDLVIVGLTSSLLEAFEPDELRFVIGHELGHYVFRHHDVPVGALVRGRSGIPPKKALQLFQWQRYAEISSDRAGLVCSGDLKATARAFFKIASGLRGARVNFDIDAYLDQIGDIREEAAEARRGDERMRADWFASHPFSPLRIRAAQLCAESEIFTEGGTSTESLESSVQELMAIMEPSYLLDTSPAGEAMRRVLLAGGILVASAVGGIADEELEALQGFLGKENVPKELNPEALRGDLDERIEFARKHVPPLQLSKVVRDLSVIAMADGHQHEAELSVIYELAEKLGVPRMVVERSIEATRAGLD